IADPQAGAVIAMGTEAETERAKTLLAELDGETPEAPPASFSTIEIRHGDAAAIAGTLQSLLRDRGRWPESLQSALRAGRAVPEPQATADAVANRITISAPEALLPFAAEVVAQLDQPRGRGTVDTRVFSLERAKAADVANALRQALDNAFRGEPPASRPTLIAEPSSNTLVASGTAAQLQKIAELVTPMDAAVADSATVRTVFLAHARAEQVAPLVKDLLDPEPAIDTRGMPGWLQVEMLRSRQQRGVDVVRAVADRRLNAVILTGPVSELDAAERMVKELDQRAASETSATTSIEVIAIRNGDAASIAQSLEAMFEDSGAATPPTIRTDASGMALLVRGDSMQIARIRSLAEELDRAAAGSRRMRSVAIDPARADAAEVARLLDRMLERDGDAVEVVSLEELLARFPDAMPPADPAKP
ncbi:MAG: Bacterial type secretion system short domain, partial [Planctomycetota bacterium]